VARGGARAVFRDSHDLDHAGCSVSSLTRFSLGWLVADLGLYKEVVVQMNRDKYAGLYL